MWFLSVSEMLGKPNLVLLFLWISGTDAHIWAWMLNMPHSPPKEGPKALRESTPVAKALTVRICMLFLNLWFHISLCKNESSVSLNMRIWVLFWLQGLPAVCDSDRACGRGFSCDRHFSVCVPLRGEGQYCRRDAQCVRGLKCMFGRCHRSIPIGQEGKDIYSIDSKSNLSLQSHFLFFIFFFWILVCFLTLFLAWLRCSFFPYSFLLSFIVSSLVLFLS